MTRHLDPDRTLEDWLAEGPSQLPDQAVHHIVRLLDETEQRKPTWLSGIGLMNRIYLSLGAAVVGVAVLATALYLTQQNTGSNLPSQRPQPTASASVRYLTDEVLTPGAYRVIRGGVPPVQITVPAGWEGFGGVAIVKNDRPGGDVVASIAFWPSQQVSQIYADPCNWKDGFVEPQPAQEPAAIAEALANQPQRGDAQPVDVSVDGHDGKMIELTVPRIDLSQCDDGEVDSWLGRGHQVPGEIDRVYLIDVDGSLLVIDVMYTPDVTSPIRAELDSMFNSIVIE
jgi:hypothetical protein